jgi:membrane protein required for colicin V production
VNFIDIIFILIILSFAIHGFIKGLIHELASLAGLIFGIYVSFQFSGILEVYLAEYLRIPEKYTYITSFILIFIVVVITIHLIGKLIEKMIGLIALGLLNKLAGSIFGALKAIVLLSLALLILNHFNMNLISKKKKEDSIFYKPIERVAPLLWEGFEKYGRDKLPEPEIQQKKDIVMNNNISRKKIPSCS